MTENLKDKIWGSLAGVAIGDALGMPFHELTPAEIKDRCGGLATVFLPAFEDEFIHLDFKAGQITDDTTLTIVTAEAIIKYHGNITVEQFLWELADWVKNNQHIWKYGGVYGPSTRAAFENLLQGNYNYYLTRKRNWCFAGTSNGAVMRVSPAGLAHPGNIEKAVELACTVILPTHPTDVALSAASGLAAAISEALKSKATIDTTVDAMLRGTKLGEERGKKIARIIDQRYPLPCLEIALELAAKAKDPFEAGDLIRRLIGSHLHASETLATAAGIFYASKGNPESAIIAAVNNGGDTDTIGCVVGALAGALNGIYSIPENWVKTVEEVNKLNLENLAKEMSRL